MRRIGIEVSVGGTAEQLIAEIQESSRSLREQGVKEVFTELSTERIPYSEGRAYPVLFVYGTTRRKV